MKANIRLTPGERVLLEFTGSETLARATVLQRRDEALGWGWSFEQEKRGRIWIYEKDMRVERAPGKKSVVYVMDGR